MEDTEKVACVVTDNAANIVSAVKTAGFKHLPCFAHRLNLVVQQGVVCLVKSARRLDV